MKPYNNYSNGMHMNSVGMGAGGCDACKKGKCCMWLVNKVEIHFAKIGFMDCK